MSEFEPAQFLILVVDDQRQNLFLLKKVLEKAEYQILLASGGQDALERVKEHPPDLILLDLMMPEMDGLEVCHRLQEHPVNREIPVIFLTADREKTSLLEAFKHGAVDYVTKPFNAPELLARIRTHLALKHTRDELDKARAGALEVARFKSEFLAHMSHEIRAPMNGVLGMTELLGRTSLDTTQQEYVQTLKTSGEYLLNILNDILDISKLDAGGIQIDPHEFDVHAMLEGIINLFTAPAQKKGLHLSYQLQPHVPQYLVGDSLRIRQILINLVNNSLRFTEKGLVKLTAELVETQDNQVMLQLAVTDTGIGIAPEAQRRLFQAFSQAETSTARQYGGTGLGLAICKQLVELMDGEIGVESQLGEGARFWVMLPLEVASSTPVAESAEKIPSTQAKKIKQSQRILLVEDTRINQKVVRHQLSLLGYEADLVTNGQEAVDRLKQQPYDLVLMDCQMPVLDGFQATRILREREAEGEDLVIVGLTARASERDRDQCLDVGMNDLLTKPLSVESLKETLQKWLSPRLGKIG